MKRAAAALDFARVKGGLGLQCAGAGVGFHVRELLGGFVIDLLNEIGVLSKGSRDSMEDFGIWAHGCECNPVIVFIQEESAYHWRFVQDTAKIPIAD